MGKRNCIALGLVITLAGIVVAARQVLLTVDTALSSFVSIAQSMARSPWAESQRSEAERYRLIRTAAQRRRSAGRSEPAGYQVCLLGAQSCMALEQRPFRPCLATDPSCDQGVYVELLGYRLPANMRPL